MTMIHLILLVIFFIFLESFFSGSEIGLVSVNRIKLKVLAESKQRKAVIIQKMLDNPNRMLCTMLVGTNIAIVSATAIFTNIIFSIYGKNSEWIATAAMVPIMLVFGEFIPKTVYSKQTDTLTYISSPFLHFFWRLLYPIVSVITFISENILKIFGIKAKSSKKSPFVTREELKYLIRESEAHGVVGPHERNIIYKIFDFGRKKTGQMMNKMDKLIYFGPENTIVDLLKKVQHKNYSRFPIKSLDKRGFAGLVSTLDVIYEDDKSKTLSGFMRPISTVSVEMLIDDVLLMLQRKKELMAIVVNQDQIPVGFVTIEDLLEEIVGEI